MSERNDSTPSPTPRRVAQEITHRYDWSEIEPTMAVVRTVSVAANREPLDHRPLYDAVDADALNDLFASDRQPPSGLTASFTYGGFDVTVTAAGRVTVRPAEGSELPA